jgi:hypothetical protein
MKETPLNARFPVEERDSFYRTYCREASRAGSTLQPRMPDTPPIPTFPLKGGRVRIDPADSLVEACENLAREQRISARAVVLLGAEIPGAQDALRRLGLVPAAAGERAIVVLGWRRTGLDEFDAAHLPLESIDAVVVIGAPAALTRGLFDRGLLRVSESTYVPSTLIDDPHSLGAAARSVVAMTNLGHNAGFANQLFQYAFLRLYGLRNGAAVETPSWIGEQVFGIPHRPIARSLPMVKGDEWSMRDLAFWTQKRPPVDVDFWGYFQNPPPVWQPHRAFLRRLFSPLPAWREPVRQWLEKHRPPGTTLVAIHVRRGDYLRLAAEKPWFRPIPEAWYLRWLAQIWPTLKNPVLFVATDDRASVLPSFAAYHPIDASEAEARMPEPRLLADFEILAHSDVLAACNSSFSHMAALLAGPAQRAFIASPKTESFEPWDPWASDDFWRRFGAPTARRRSLLPRFLRATPA